MVFYWEAEYFPRMLAQLHHNPYLLRGLRVFIHSDKSHPLKTYISGFPHKYTDNDRISFFWYGINFLNMAEQMLSIKTAIRDVSSLLGSIAASFEAVPKGRLYYKNIEWDKVLPPKQNKGKFKAMCCLSPLAILELKYFKANILQVYWELPLPSIDFNKNSDASTKGRGCTWWKSGC